MKIPASVAVIMDGNRRWAKKRGLPPAMGHKEGCKAVEQLIPDAASLGIRYLTVYAFSTENWNRAGEEVDALMQLFRYYAGRLLEKAKKSNVRIRMIGERSRFPKDIADSIDKMESETKDNTGLTFVMAVNYGGRDEIVRAVSKYTSDVLDGKKSLSDLNEKDFSMYLDTKEMPDPDLLIRTSGEIRLSNFLSWQSAYSEIVISDVLWPDFNKEELIKCIEEYNRRNRRFGGA